ncbi:MAG TPA: hypothetical protein VIY53_21090 [Acidobacteriaceae bacterium]
MNRAFAGAMTMALTFWLTTPGKQAATPAAQTAAPSSDTERSESGNLHIAGGDVVMYRIRLLPVASFPKLPGTVAAELTLHGCMIPQTFEAQQPENVIEGAFQQAGSSDWAALCSVSGSTTLYVFFSGEFDRPIALRSQQDTAWLGAEPGSSVFGSAWGIATRSAAYLRTAHPLHGDASFDHDGIEDARLERSETIRYWQQSRWLAFDLQN